MERPFLFVGRDFAEEARRCTVVGVGVVRPVGVELDLAVVEVEDRRVRELVIGLRLIIPVHLGHQTLSLTSRWLRNYALSALSLFDSIPTQCQKPAPDQDKQYPLNTTRS